MRFLMQREHLSDFAFASNRKVLELELSEPAASPRWACLAAVQGLQTVDYMAHLARKS